MTPYISIIIPVYKVEKYLSECLDSIINWKFTHWEAILIDDGSPDNSGIVCDEYAAKDIRFKVIHKKNEGVSVARNVGLNIARGEWCWFVDSDDVIDSDTPIDINLLKDKDMVMFDILPFNDGDSIPVQNGDGKIHECKNLNDFFSTYISWAHPTLWYRKMFWDKDGRYALRFSKGVRLGEDGEFMRKCELLSSNPIKINYTSYYYRQRQGSVTHSPEKDKITIDDAFTVLKNIAEHISYYRIAPAEWKTLRVATIAKSIPTHAVKCNRWNRCTIKSFQAMIQSYNEMGYNLLNDRTIKTAAMMPWVYIVIAKIKY